MVDRLPSTLSGGGRWGVALLVIIVLGSLEVRSRLYSLSDGCNEHILFVRRGQTHTGAGATRDLINKVTDLQRNLRAARQRLDIDIRKNYGSYTDLVFNLTEIMTDVVQSGNISRHRLKRRMKRKILESVFEGDAAVTTKYTWVTAGNSVAAGHGNLMSQSYTAIVERSLTPLFSAIGLQFEAKLRAYSGIRSAPEVSLCMDAFFGTDIDLILWDFGATDGSRESSVWRYRMFTNRAALHKTFPAILMLGGASQKDLVQSFEDKGQAVLGISDLGALRSRMPDSTTHANPDGLPPAIRYFLCKSSENGEPCVDFKFNTSICGEEKIQGKVNWHFGWKENLFRGTIYSLFVAEILDECIEEIIKDVNEGRALVSKETIQLYRSQEEEDRAVSIKSFPHTDEYGASAVGADLWPLLNRGNAVCHSMRQASQARCDGLVDGKIGRSRHTLGSCINMDHYIMNEEDLSLHPLANAPADSTLTTDVKHDLQFLKTPWLVASDQTLRYDCGNITVTHDFSDSFVVRYSDGWMGNIYPNAKPLKAYSYESERRGVIIICERTYPKERMPAHVIGLKQLGTGNATIFVDGLLVSGARLLGGGAREAATGECFALYHGDSNSTNFGPGTKNGRRGQYEIKFKVEVVGKILEFISLIVI